MTKKYIAIKYDNKPILVLPLQEGTTADYLKLKKEAEKNLDDLFKNLESLKDRIIDLEKEVKHLKGED